MAWSSGKDCLCTAQHEATQKSCRTKEDTVFGEDERRRKESKHEYVLITTYRVNKT